MYSTREHWKTIRSLPDFEFALVLCCHPRETRLKENFKNHLIECFDEAQAELFIEEFRQAKDQEKNAVVEKVNTMFITRRAQEDYKACFAMHRLFGQDISDIIITELRELY